MAKSKRAAQENATYANPVGYGKAQLAEDLLIMIRKRIEVSDIAGMHLVRLEAMDRRKADLLAELLERETRR